MRRNPLTELQIAQCSRFSELRKRFGLTQREVAEALKDFSEREASSGGRIANWEYKNAPIPTGIWKKLPLIFSKALESKKRETSSALSLLSSIKADWATEIQEASLQGVER